MEFDERSVSTGTSDTRELRNELPLEEELLAVALLEALLAVELLALGVGEEDPEFDDVGSVPAFPQATSITSISAANAPAIACFPRLDSDIAYPRPKSL